MATPLTAGTAALVRQYFIEGFYPTGVQIPSNSLIPTGALVKAVLMNGAQFLHAIDLRNGKEQLIEPYDNVQNFGRVSLSDSLYLPGFSSGNIEVWDKQEIEDGDTMTYNVTIDMSKGCNATKLSVTLVWMERGSPSGCTKCVLNNLDLSVYRDGDSKVHYPNGLDGPDDINNAERVQVHGIKDGEKYYIDVKATNLEFSKQKYSLVATGCFGGVENILASKVGTFVSDSPKSSADDSLQSRYFALSLSALAGGLLFALF